MAEKEAQRNPLEAGKGRIDEVDQSKGIFPPGKPHPPDAEPRMPGAFGGGSYQESGRGGVELPTGSIEQRAPVGGFSEEPKTEERNEPKEPAGALPPHERSKP